MEQAHMTLVKHMSAFCERKPRSVMLVIFLLAFVLRMAIILALGLYKYPYRYEMHRIAMSLVNSGVYGNPFPTPTGPSAHYSPGFTLLLSAIYSLFGTG